MLPNLVTKVIQAFHLSPIPSNDHMLFCNNVVSLEDFKIFANSNSEFHFKIKERLLISRDKLD